MNVNALLNSSVEDWLAGSKMEDSRLASANLSGTELELHAVNCLVEHTSYSGSTLLDVFLRDVRFFHCDFSNSNLDRSRMKRVEFVECRLTGLKSIECHWSEVSIEGCECAYSQLTDSTVEKSKFRDSTFVDADFRGVKFSGSVFEQCNFRRADLTRSKLKDLDLRGVEIEEITLRAEDLSGAIVSPAQAIDLARFFGLKVR